MIPEFIGRLPILTSTKELTEEDLVRVPHRAVELASCASTSTSSSWTAWTWSSRTMRS